MREQAATQGTSQSLEMRISRAIAAKSWSKDMYKLANRMVRAYDNTKDEFIKKLKAELREEREKTAALEKELEEFRNTT